MEVKMIDHGCPKKYLPNRAHPNDVGADVYAVKAVHIEPHCSLRVPLGFGIEVPPGYAAFVFPRSSTASVGVDAKLAPIDPYYTGEVHAILCNTNPWPVDFDEGTRIGQLVFFPCVTPVLTFEPDRTRGGKAFGSTGA